MAQHELMVWLDMEMSGLDPEHDRVLEIAVLISDAQLRVVAEGPNLVLRQSEAVLAAMDDWNQSHHTASGLVDRVRTSTVDEAAAEEAVLEFLTRHTASGRAPLAGNSVHQDRRFLARYLPRVEAFLHYRIVDVSTVKELVRRWLPQVHQAKPSKQQRHRALDDIHESLAELRFYKQQAFRS